MHIPLKHFRQSQFAILILGLFLLGCIEGAVAKSTFEKYEVVTGSAKQQTVLTGFLLGNAIAELVVVNIDEQNDCRLRIYGFADGAWRSRLEATLRPGVLFVDVANIDGRDRLVTYERGRLNWFDPESGTERALVAVASNFNPLGSGEIPHVDITRDVNGDDRDDLVVPDRDGFWVFVQMSNGVFAAPVKLGPAPRMEIYNEAVGYRYDPWSESRVHRIDYNGDGRSDLVFWNEDHFAVHQQDKRGIFPPVARTFTTSVAFDSDDLASLAAPHGVRGRRTDQQPTGDLTGRVMHSLTDQNGDGVADLVVFSLKGGSLWRMEYAYEVHFGTATPDGRTLFAPDVGTTIQAEGIPFGMAQHDFDNDGQIDIVFTNIEVGIFKAVRMVIGALLTRSVSLDLEFYRMKGGTYPDKANATRKIKTISLGKSGEKTIFPPMLIGDVNGDGRADLLLGWKRKELRVFNGVPGPDLFARRPHKLKVVMPRHEEYTWLVDLNSDGKQDIFMHHPSTTEPHRVTMLLAR